MAYLHVWKLLHDRADITNLLHEILGQYTISTYQKDIITSRPLAAHLFVQIRVLFDLQRAHLQAQFPSTVPRSHLVQAPELFKTISYILQIRSDVLGKIDSDDNRSLDLRCFAARVLMSGLRAILLTGIKFSKDDIDDLYESVGSWCRKTTRNDLEEFILKRCRDMIDQISQHEPRGEACSQQPIFGGMGIDLRKKSNDKFRQELKRLREGVDVSFWTLFDILWASEVDSFQDSCKSLSAGHTRVSHRQVDILCESLSDQNLAELCLKTDVLGWSHREAISQSQAHIRHSSQPNIGPWNNYPVQDSLEDFRMLLERRQLKILDTPLEIKHLDDQLEDCLKVWYRQASNIEDLDSLYSKVNEALTHGRLQDLKSEMSCTYILSCPQLHVLPWFWLNHLITESGEGIQATEEDPTRIEFRAPIRCPRCNSTKYIDSARKVEPLYQISVEIANQIRRTQIQAHPEDFLEKDDMVPERSMSAVALSPVASSRSSPECKRQYSLPERTMSFVSVECGTTAGPKSLKSRLSFPLSLTKSRSPPDMSPPIKSPAEETKSTVWSHNFTVDNENLLLWTSGGNYLFASDVPKCDQSDVVEPCPWKEYVVPGVMFVTGSKGMVAAVSESSKLFIFSEHGSSPLLSKQLNEGSSVRSIKISTQGTSVAVGFDTCFLIYNIDSGNDATPTTRQLLNTNPKAHFNSQRLSFSRDGAQLVVATRTTLHSQGHVEINLHDSVDPRRSWRRLLDPVSLPNDDFGLSGVFSDSHLKNVVLTGFINKPYHVVHTISGGEVSNLSNSRGGNSDRRFQAAAQAPSGSNYTLVNAGGHLFQLDLRQKQSAIQDLKVRLDLKESPRSSDHFISIAMPDEETTCAFWIENRMGVLNTVRQGSKLPRRLIQLPDPHSIAPFPGA